jgi:hypothetical protein
VNEQPARYRAVTAAHVTAFAKQYLGAHNRATLMYVPMEEETETEVAA